MTQPPAAAAGRRGSRHGYLRVVVALALLALAWSRIQPEAVLAALTHASPGPLLLSFALLIVERVGTVAKWVVLLRARGWDRPHRDAFIIFWGNNFFGLFLPTGLGLDVLNAYRTHRAGMRLADSTSVVTVDRALSLVSLACLVACSWVLTTHFRVELTGAVITLGVATAAALLFLAFPAKAIVLEGVSRFRVGAALAHRLESFHTAVVAFRSDRGALALNFALSILVQLLRVLQLAVLIRALGPGIGWRNAMVVVPACNVVTALPVSIGGGLGLRENAFLYFFPRIGVPEEDAMALSVLVLAWVVIWVLPGGLYALFRKDGTWRR